VTQPGSTAQPILSRGCLAGAQPRLLAARLTLRPWEQSDAPALVRAYADPDIHRWHARSMSFSQAEAWIDHEMNRWVQELGGSWAITREGSVLGRVGIGGVEGTLRARALHLDGWHDMHAHGLLAGESDRAG
jgi:RimJ/RimL family protein N-acetyltransferase